VRGETPTLLGSLERANLIRWTTEKVQDPNNSECHTPPSDPFRIYLKKLIFVFDFQICLSMTLNILLSTSYDWFLQTRIYLIIQPLSVQNANLLKLTKLVWRLFVSTNWFSE
jgi:hypothetical protein